MPSRHTTVEITSAEIKNLSSALEQARDAMSEWQTSHSKWGLDWDEPDSHYMALAGVLGAIESVKALEKQLFKQHSRKEIKQPGENVGKISDWLADREFKAQRAFETQLDRDLDKQLDKADAIGRANGVQHSPTVAELRDLGKKEPEWVQEASAFKRSGDLGEFSDERRAQMDRSHGIKDSEQYHRTIGGYSEVAPSDSVALRQEYSQRRAAQEHAKQEAVRELARDDGYEMG